MTNQDQYFADTLKYSKNIFKKDLWESRNEFNIPETEMKKILSKMCYFNQETGYYHLKEEFKGVQDSVFNFPLVLGNNRINLQFLE